MPYSKSMRILILGSGPASTQVLQTLSETLSGQSDVRVQILTYDHKNGQDFIHAHEALKSEEQSAVYFQTPRIAPLSVSTVDEVWGSFTLGGWGNVWGATLYEDPNQISEDAALMGLFEDFQLSNHPKRKVPEFLTNRKEKKEKGSLGHSNHSSILISPLAIAPLSDDINSGCNQCGDCLSGCPMNHIWNPRKAFLKLLKPLRAEVVYGFATRIHSSAGSTEVHYINQDEPGKVTVISADVILIGLGAIQSASLLIRSKLIPSETGVKDSQMILVPFMRKDFRVVGKYESRIALSEGVTSDKLEVGDIQGDFFSQIYGYSKSLDKVLCTRYSFFRFIPNSIRHNIFKFFGVAMIFLSEEFSGKLELSLSKFETISQKSVLPSVSYSKVKPVLRKNFKEKGLFLLTALSKVYPVGKSYHLGNIFETEKSLFDFDTGNLHSHKNIYILDGASLNRISSFPITIRIMKNADRITKKIVESFKV